MFVKVKALRRELRTKSLYRIRERDYFYGTADEVWADYELLRLAFSCFQGQKRTGSTFA